MIIKKYLVDDINEALFRIKHELGDDAYIISQKMVRQSGVRGLFSTKKLEVTVGLANKEGVVSNVPAQESELPVNLANNSVNFKSELELQNKEKPLYSSNYAQNIYSQNDSSKSMSYYNKLFEEKQKMLNESYNNRLVENDEVEKFKNLNKDSFLKNTADLKNTTENVNKSEIKNENIDYIKRELSEIKNIIQNLEVSKSNAVSQPNYLDEILSKNYICKELCEDIRSKCTLSENELFDKKIVKKYLRNVFSNIIKIQNDEVLDKVILVGPTGAGKTTTIAKLASLFSLQHNKKVGLITLDTYRVAAAEQLRMYANIINAPYGLITNINDIKETFDGMSFCDITLIDTVGIGSRNIMQLNELSTYIKTIKSSELDLIINAGMKYEDAESFINLFKGVNFRSVIITKLDETNSFGMFVNICYKTSLPISYITFGQDVPLDIKGANKEEILNLILGADEL